MITVINQRRRQVLLTLLTDYSAVYDALSGHLYRAKSITRFDKRYGEWKLSNTGVWEEVPKRSTLIFGDT